MIKKISILFILVIGLILSVTYVAFGSPNSASQSLQMPMTAMGANSVELTDPHSAVSGLSESFSAMAAVGPCDVDFDGSGVVDVGDIMYVANCWRSADSACDPYDLDSDVDIDIVDIMLVAAQWGNTCSISPFAIDMGGQDTDPTRRDLAAAAGFTMHRTSVSWASIEPNAPVGGVHTYNWPDSTFNIYRNDRRLIPYVIVMNNPSWAVPVGQPTCGPIDSDHLDDFGEFVGQLVSRYADVTPYWVFYNEEDLWTTPYVGHDAGGCWGGNGAEYAQMLAVAWDAAHSANPNAQVIFGAAAYEPVWDGGATWDRFFFRDAFEYMEDNPDDYVDIILANQYNAFRDDWDGASITSPENQEIIAKFRQAVSDASFNPNTPGAYSIYKWQTEYGLDTPMATGEVGLQVSVGPGGVPTMEELQARHAVHVNVRGMAAGLEIICWYTLADKGGGELNYGLLHGNLTPRPAYYAYQVLTQQLDGYGFDQQLVVSGKPKIQAYRFDDNGVKKLVLWRDSGEKIKNQSSIATETMTVSATELGAGWTGRLRVTDKLGNVSTYGYSGAPSVDLAFSSDPIYVEAY
ncbi:MAG: hypothetical protein H8E47_06990 [Anaerolineales bacterium]|nr:hypothetical protein [Anaerolineales bacterium]